MDTQTPTAPLLTHSDVFLTDEIAPETPVFLIAYHPDVRTAPELGAPNGSIIPMIRWFGQAMPKGYRPSAIVNARGDVLSAIDIPGWPVEDLASFAAALAFTSDTGGLGAAALMEALYSEPIDVLRLAIRTEELRAMPVYRAAALLLQHVDELTDVELADALGQVSRKVYSAATNYLREPGDARSERTSQLARFTSARHRG